jgi:hypothetical protein
MNWFKQLFSRRRRYDELSETIREHLDEKIADLTDRGMTREQAERAARRELAMSLGSKSAAGKCGSGLLSNHSGRNGHMDYQVAIGTAVHS